MNEIIISGPQIYTDNDILKKSSLIITNGIIAGIPAIKQQQGENVLTFPSSYHLIPGFIDLHVHGANNRDVMDAAPEALKILSKTLAVEGVTGFLATTMTAALVDIEKALLAVHNYMQQPQAEGAAILGVHLEGPFISPAKAGAQNTVNVLSPSSHYLIEWQKTFGNIIKLVTLAPELPNSLEFIRYLQQHKIIASIGHTNATYAEANDAIKEGCHYVTHLFNAMRGIHQREPGVVTAALLSEKVNVELIVDGIHLHPAIIQLVLKLKGADHLILVTDAMRAKCLGDGVYDLGGQAVYVQAGIPKLSDGTLAGSVLRMSDAIRHMLQYTDCSLYEVIKMASKNPAIVLGVFAKKGSIALHKDADLVVLDDDLCVVMTMVGGRVVYQVH